jgi:hypothetical protein
MNSSKRKRTLFGEFWHKNHLIGEGGGGPYGPAGMTANGPDGGDGWVGWLSALGLQRQNRSKEL